MTDRTETAPSPSRALSELQPPLDMVAAHLLICAGCSAVDPKRLGRSLEHIFVLEVDQDCDEQQFRVRLAGTRLELLFQQGLRGSILGRCDRMPPALPMTLEHSLSARQAIWIDAVQTSSGAATLRWNAIAVPLGADRIYGAMLSADLGYQPDRLPTFAWGPIDAPFPRCDRR